MSSAPPTPLTYEQAGVNYDLIDPLKVAAQRAAAATGLNLAGHGFSEVAASRGESAYVVDIGSMYLASIVECLITVGATPLVVQAYWAAGGSDWFKDAVRAQALVAGWKKACDTCGVAWGGGETPALAGVVADGRVDLAASCTGIVSPKSRLSLGDRLGAGDAIVFLASSGIHANGLSLARKLAERLPRGLLTDIGGGQSFGEALLAPTVLYSPVTEALAAAGIVPHYSANVTGHGWRKLMRHPKALSYRITALPAKTAVLDFMQRECALDDHEAYGTLNMGAGFALYLAAADAARAVEIAQGLGIAALVAGQVEAGAKRVVIDPLGVEFAGDELQLR
jgi:phosphoribosylformylglycinamidine cyclo-ligase